MTPNTRHLTFSLAGALLLLAGSLHAQTTRFDAQPLGSKVKLEGTSTVHDWTMEGAIIGGFVELDSGFVAAPDKAQPGKVAATAQVTIPIRSLKSGKDSMDAVMQDAMKQDQFPRIVYRLTALTLKATPKSAEGPYEFNSNGELIISGVTNKVSFPVTMQRVEGKKLKTSGSTSVKMTAFGIQPPAPKIALGFITTGDDVKVSFDWLSSQK
ncbi:MAG TPA: YceI family protein [Gemmataceae bacterium]|nr:YceI family protein [Gemmataceae bacterium]